MKHEGVLAFTFAVLLLNTCTPSDSVEKGTAPELQPAIGKTSISDSLAQLFLRFHGSGSIIVRGQCTDASFILDEVPRGPAGAFSSLGDALAEWSRLVPRLTVRHNVNDMWRVSDSTASAELLKLKINELRADVLDSDGAVGAILETSEVKQFLHVQGISQASTMGGPGSYDASKLPHSPWHLHNVTVGEAFDSAVNKYPGVWVYTECVSDDHHKLMNVRALSF